MYAVETISATGKTKTAEFVIYTMAHETFEQVCELARAGITDVVSATLIDKYNNTKISFNNGKSL